MGLAHASESSNYKSSISELVVYAREPNTRPNTSYERLSIERAHLHFALFLGTFALAVALVV